MHTHYPAEFCAYIFSLFDMKKGASFLDVGCGRGEFTQMFQKAGLNVHALDKDKSDSEFLKDIDTQYLNFEKDTFPFPDNTFDVVFSKSVIEHLNDPEHFLKEQYRVLKTGGRIICIAPNWMTQMKIFYDNHTHRQPYTKLGLHRALAMYGFKDVSSEIFYQVPIIWKYPWLVVVSRVLQLFGPVTKVHKNSFIRWSRELMILGTGIKTK